MMQELRGGSNVGIIGKRSKISTPPCGGGGDGGILDHGSPSPSPSSSAAESLRCPRCDSANTKFCYYNNYNLTQPRHFCKTCRRYWTKGGALRNVPIGGGCRKNKSTPIAAPVGKSSGAASKFKSSTASSEIGKTSLFGGFEHADALSSNPLIWASSQNSHFLSLIRGNQNQNQNQNQTSNPNHHLCMKEESGGSLFGAPHFSSDAAVGRAFSLDHLGPAHFPSYRNQTLSSQGLILHGEVQNNGLQELYNRLRSSATSCYSDHAPVILGSMASANSSSTAAILESAPVAAAEMGFWNSTVSWPENFTTTTTNGAYP